MCQLRHPRRFLGVVFLCRVPVAVQFARVATPEEVMERPRRRATQLESAMQLLDAGDPALIPLQEALKKAKAQAATPPLADRVSASEMYVARKKKRLEEAEGEILEAIKRRDVLKAEVVAGEERLVKAEVTRAASVPMPVSTDVGVGDEIAHLNWLPPRRNEMQLYGAIHRKDKPQCHEPAEFAHEQTTSLPCPLWFQQN